MLIFRQKSFQFSYPRLKTCQPVLTIVAKNIFAPNYAHFVISAVFVNLYKSFTQKCAEYVNIHKGMLL